MRALVIGGAGFIGSHLVDALVAEGKFVTVYDNLSSGRRDWVSRSANLILGDVRTTPHLATAMAGQDIVYHLSANPEARLGLKDRHLDLREGTEATLSALEAAHLANVGRFVFASSGTVYGEQSKVCTERDVALPISLYGASKLASEALVSAYCHCFDMKATILRFGNVVGPRATHGCILDFLRQLREHPDHLRVLGDGNQAKPYLHVSDCVRGILFTSTRGMMDGPSVYNLAPNDRTSVRQIAELCAAGARIEYTGGQRGWPGDVARSLMSNRKLKAFGWSPSMDSNKAVTRAVEEIRAEVLR